MVQLVWKDRSGNDRGTVGQPQRDITQPTLSPDGRRVAVRGGDSGNLDIWIHDVDRPIKSRLTSDDSLDSDPVWSPAGDRIAFSSGRSGGSGIYVTDSDGTHEPSPLFSTSGARANVTDWSRDGQILLFGRIGDGQTNEDVWYLKRKPGGGFEEIPLLETRFNERAAQLSPDGRYVAYSSDQWGQFEIYVRPFPGGGAPRRVSVNGGTQPRWRQDGEELFYVEGNTLMAVAGLASGSLTVLAPVKLCSAWSLGPGDAGYRCYDVTPDGEQFLLCESDAEQLGGQLVQNWFAEFKDQQAAP